MTNMTAKLERFAESCLPSQAPVYRVTDVDYQEWADEGVEGMVFDVEDTFAAAGAKLLNVELTWAAAKARAVGMRIAIGTNKPVKTRADELMLDGWGEQLGADLVLPPLRPQDAKPSPINLHKARTHWQLEPEQMGMAGDKCTADIRAANFAGFEHSAWTRPIGGNRHPGDRLIRDPAEKMLRLYAHLALNPKFSELSEVEVKEILERKQAWLEFKDGVLLAPVEASTAPSTNNIVGYGVEDIELDQAVLDTIMRPAFRVALEKAQSEITERTQNPREWLDAILYEHGRFLADFMTDLRPYLGALIVGLNFLDIPPELKRKASLVFKTIADVTDAGDGFAARKDKDGATVDGARRDQLYDKFVEVAADASLAPHELIGMLDILLPLTRNMVITDVRKPFVDRGMDTKSVLSGKISTGVKSAAQTYALVRGRERPRAAANLMRAGTIFKIASMVDGPLKWIEAYEREQHERLNYERYMAQLAINKHFDIYAAYKA